MSNVDPCLAAEIAEMITYDVAVRIPPVIPMNPAIRAVKRFLFFIFISIAQIALREQAVASSGRCATD